LADLAGTALFASGAATAVTARKAGGICLDLTSDDARLRRYYAARTAQRAIPTQFDEFAH